MARWGRVLVLGGVLCAPAAEAAGPWRAQVVDAESGHPLADVAVLAVWHRHPAGHPPIPIGIGKAGYFASDETVTGPDGWFTIPARVLFNPSLVLRVVGPELTLFHAGHGGWRFVGPAGLTEARSPDRDAAASHGRRAGPLPHIYGVTGDSRPDQPPLRRWDATGAEVAAWGARGDAAGQVFDPIAFAVDRRGRVYVADWGGPRVIVFDSRGSFVHQWDARAGDATGLRYPSGLAVDARGRVYVVDRASPRVHVLGPLPGG